MANNIIQVKRTSTSGRQPNTTGSYATNSQYISAGEFALNMADGILYTSNGTAVITVGANIVNQSVTNNFNVTTAFIANTTGVKIAVPLNANGSVGTGGQVLTTNGATGSPYWSTVTGGSGSPGGANTQIQFNDSTAFAGNAAFTFDKSTNKVFVGNSTANAIIGFDSANTNSMTLSSNVNTYVTSILWNSNSGTAASGDFTVYTNDGYATGNNFIDMGINSSTWSNAAWTINGARDGYLYTGGGNLSVGTNTSTSYLNFFTGGTLAANERMRITPTGNVGIGNTAPVDALSVNGNTVINNILSANTKINIGGVSGFDFANSASLEVNGNANTYIQSVIQNSNAGLAASTDFAVTADTGNDSINYVNLGINSSLYNQSAYNITGALDAYLYSSNSHLAIGTASAKEVIFHANGTTSTDRKFTINATAVTFANSVAIVANGSVGISGQVLSSNGTGIYWATAGAASVNVAAQYTWTNTQTFSNTITFSTNILVGTSVNAASYTTGNSGTGTGGFIANVTTIFTGNNTVNAFLNTTGLNINAVTIANTTGVYTGVVNGSSITVGTTLIANSTTFIANGASVAINPNTVFTGANIYFSNTAKITLSVNTGIVANGTLGTAGQVLMTNGTVAYWNTVTASASAGGANTQIQFNDSGSANGTAGLVFDKTTNNMTVANTLTVSGNLVANMVSLSVGNSTSNVIISNNTIVLAGTNNFIVLPSMNTAATGTPAANNLNFYDRYYASRNIPAWIGPDARENLVQANMGRARLYYVAPVGINTTTAPQVFTGTTAVTNSVTGVARTYATTNILTRTTRLGFATTTTAGTIANIRQASAFFSTGSGSATNDGSGFTTIIRFGVSDGAAVTGARSFFGVSSSTAVNTNVEPNTLTNSAGFAQISTDATQWYFVYGGSAAQTNIALGTGLGAPTNTAIAWEGTIFSPQNANGVIGYQLTNMASGVTASGTITPGTPGTQTPLNTTGLTYQMWRTNNATALAAAFDLISIYIETPT